jgi:hypothetical protein
MLWLIFLGNWSRYRKFSSDACGAEIKDLEGYTIRRALTKTWPRDNGNGFGDRSGTINNKNDGNALSFGIG